MNPLTDALVSVTGLARVFTLSWRLSRYLTRVATRVVSRVAITFTQV